MLLHAAGWHMAWCHVQLIVVCMVPRKFNSKWNGATCIWKSLSHGAHVQLAGLLQGTHALAVGWRAAWCHVLLADIWHVLHDHLGGVRHGSHTVKKSFVSDIPARDKKIANLFYSSYAAGWCVTS